VLTTETQAVETIQTLVGSIGLVASVPLTTALGELGRHSPDARNSPCAQPANRAHWP
jgi:uncharacterized membrane protein